jgi:hypothetical protein
VAGSLPLACEAGEQIAVALSVIDLVDRQLQRATRQAARRSSPLTTGWRRSPTSRSWPSSTPTCDETVDGSSPTVDRSSLTNAGDRGWCPQHTRYVYGSRPEAICAPRERPRAPEVTLQRLDSRGLEAWPLPVRFRGTAARPCSARRATLAAPSPPPSSSVATRPCALARNTRRTAASRRYPNGSSRSSGPAKMSLTLERHGACGFPGLRERILAWSAA